MNNQKTKSEASFRFFGDQFGAQFACEQASPLGDSKYGYSHAVNVSEHSKPKSKGSNGSVLHQPSTKYEE